MEYQIWYCPKCGQERDVDTRGRCVKCGSTISTTQGGFINQTLTMDDQGRMVMLYGPDRPWQEQWHTVRHRFKVLQDHYQPGNFRGHRQVQDDVEAFFLQCTHLDDWLAGDPTAPNVARGDATEFIKNNPALSICRGLANTSKHRTRDSSNSIDAAVQGVGHLNADDSARATIEWKRNGQVTHEDALDLAERCMAAWRQFLNDTGLSFVDYFLRPEEESD
jgi:hypothetical protein